MTEIESWVSHILDNSKIFVMLITLLILSLVGYWWWFYHTVSGNIRRATSELVNQKNNDAIIWLIYKESPKALDFVEACILRFIDRKDVRLALIISRHPRLVQALLKLNGTSRVPLTDLLREMGATDEEIAWSTGLRVISEFYHVDSIEFV